MQDDNPFSSDFSEERIDDDPSTSYHLDKPSEASPYHIDEPDAPEEGPPQEDQRESVQERKRRESLEARPLKDAIKVCLLTS